VIIGPCCWPNYRVLHFVTMASLPDVDVKVLGLQATPPAVVPSPPLVNGAPVSLIKLTRAGLSASPYLEPWITMVNRVYTDSFDPAYVSHSWNRLDSAAQLLRELNDESIICFLVPVESSDLRVLASVCAQPFAQPTQKYLESLNPDRRVWLPPPTPEYHPNAPRWFVKFLCVAPEIQRQGLASRLMDLIESPVRKTVRGASGIVEGEHNGVVLVLSAFKETTGAFYTRKGWRTVEDRWMAPGFIGSQTGFFVAFMDRYLPV